MFVVRAGDIVRHVGTGNFYKILMIGVIGAEDNLGTRKVVYKEVHPGKKIFEQSQTRFLEPGRFQLLKKRT